MEIAWIGSYCPDGKPHHLIEVEQIESTGIFRCKHCTQYKALPVFTHGAAIFDSMIGYWGVEVAYVKYLNKHQSAKTTLKKIIYLSTLSLEDMGTVEYAKEVDRVMRKKTFKEEATE